jgi:hypothetical protein
MRKMPRSNDITINQCAKSGGYGVERIAFDLRLSALVEAKAADAEAHHRDLLAVKATSAPVSMSFQSRNLSRRRDGWVRGITEWPNQMCK